MSDIRWVIRASTASGTAAPSAVAGVLLHGMGRVVASRAGDGKRQAVGVEGGGDGIFVTALVIIGLLARLGGLTPHRGGTSS